MSISPVEMIRQSGGTNSIDTLKHPAPSTNAEAPTSDSTPASAVTEPDATSPGKLSTDLRVDDRHRIYYQVVNNRSGEVVYEIPAETIRKLGETLNLPGDGEAVGLFIDTKS